MAARGRYYVANGDYAVGRVDAGSTLATGNDCLYGNYFEGVIMSWNVVVGHGGCCA